MRNDLPISQDKKFKYSITFQYLDEESLEEGDSFDRGYEVNDDTDNIGDVLYKANTIYGIYMPVSFGNWESTEPEEDTDYFEKGIRKFYGLHISNEDGTDISQEENDFITFLLSDGRYEINKFRDYAVGGIVLGAVALGVGALITYFYFKGKKTKKELVGKGTVNNRAKSVTHIIKGKERKFPIKDAWKREHSLENKSEKHEVPQSDRKPIKFEMGGDVYDNYAGKKDEIIAKLKSINGGLYSKAPKVFVKDNFIYVSAENGDNYANYYEDLYIDEKLEAIADEYDTYWDWEDAGSIVLSAIDTYANGGRVTTNDGIIESFLTSERELKVGNLSTHYNQYDNQMLLRNYGTLIATRKGNDVEITNTKYSKTTTIITNKVRNMALNKRMNVKHVDKFADGGEAGNDFNYYNGAGARMLNELSLEDLKFQLKHTTKPDEKERIALLEKLIEQKSKKYADGGGVGKGYMVFNYTDDIYATDEVFKTKSLANAFIKEFRNRFAKQGYYRDNQMNQIDIKDIDLLAIPSDFNPFGKYADGGGVNENKYYNNMNREDILSQTVVYDNDGESFDRYTVFTPDGSVFGMSENATGFNQYIGDNTEIEQGNHLGKKLKSVPKGIENAVLNRMREDEYADGGGVADSEIKTAILYGKMLNELNKEKQFNKKIEKKSLLDKFSKSNGLTIDHNNIIYVNGVKLAYIDKINQKTGQEKSNWEIKKFADGGEAGEWSVTDITDAEYLGIIEFEDNEGEFHNFEIMETDDRLVFGGMTNIGFIESGYIEKGGFSTDETLQSLLEDLEVYYNDGAEYTSQIVFNQRMAKGGEAGDYYEQLAVYVQGVGSIYNGTSMKKAVEKANSYLKKNKNAEIVIVDEKYGDEYDLDGNMKDEYAGGGEVEDWMEQALDSLMEETGSTDLEISYVSDNGNSFYATDNNLEYRVFKSEDDAEETAIEQVREDLEENPEYFNKDFISNYIDGRDFFKSALDEMNEGYAEDIKSESDDIYANRLIQEMVENGILNEDDALSGNAEELADYYMQDFVNLMTEGQLDEGNNGLDYFISNFGEEYTMELVIDNNLIDVDEASQDAVDTDGIGHFLSSYDGETVYLSNDSVAYRVN